MRFIDGTHLLITFRGTSILGEVALASRDGLSLVVRFEGVLGPYYQVMPLVWVGDGYKDLEEGNYVGLLSLIELSPCFQSSDLRAWLERQVLMEGVSGPTRNGSSA